MFSKFFLLLTLLYIVNTQASIITGPYLMGVTSTSVYVLVETSSTAAVTVNYGLTKSYSSAASDELNTATTSSTYVHKILLTGLTPNTVYHYNVIESSGSSVDSYFITAPDKGGKFRFAFEADMRTNTAPHDQIAALIDSANPAFLLQGGDVCYSSTYSYYKSEFFRPNELNNISHIPFFWAPGNHETWSTNTKAYSKAPQSSSGVEDYYSVDYGDLHIVVLNTQISYAVGSAQYSWVLNDLTATTQKWKIVVAHIPGYTYGGSGAHTADANMIAMSTNIFIPKGVDLVLNGHNHFYQRNIVSGLNFVVIGSAGAPLYPVGSSSYTVKSLSTYCFGIFDFEPNSLKMTVYDNNNSVIDTLTILKTSLPVELRSLRCAYENNKVMLRWNTVSELNNARFDIERKTGNQEWQVIGSVAGAGNSLETKDYSFADNNVLISGKYSYRLKQVDYDGTSKYSSIVDADVDLAPVAYSLGNNYPNPFNPSTTINYYLPYDSFVKLVIYNSLGQQVKELVNGFQADGQFNLTVDAEGLSSGIYYYTLQANSTEGPESFTSTKKMMLIK